MIHLIVLNKYNTIEYNIHLQHVNVYCNNIHILNVYNINI
jgi:hypothetical protein